MPSVNDFRLALFNVTRVRACGQSIGRTVYWKLYAIENVMRIIIHSVLNAQIGPHWWTTAVSTTLQGKARRSQAKYRAQPWHSSPGNHDIYHLNLADLNEIVRANKHLFLPVIPDIDQWLARIELIRLPRNIVAHMNWPQRIDRNRISVVCADIQVLATQLNSAFSLSIPL
jgi:hypothetical protein